MSDRKSTTARTVYRSPEGRVTVERTEDADYILSVDDCCAGVYTTQHAAEVAGLVELEYRVTQERFAAADEAAEQAADEAAAQAMDASMDMTCACQICGDDVMPDQACMVGEQMACGWCAGKALGLARFIARHGHAPGEPATPAPPRLLWSWAGNAKALQGLVSERHAAWFARQERCLLAADAAGMLAAEHYEAK